MVKITNGINTYEVPRGAARVYEACGYHIVGDDVDDAALMIAEAEAYDDGISDEEVEDADNKFVEEVMEKPVSQWTSDEIKRFAVIKDINLAGVKNTKQARGAVIAFLKEEERKASMEN